MGKIHIRLVGKISEKNLIPPHLSGNITEGRLVRGGKTLAKSEKMRFSEKQKGRKNWTGKQN